MEHRLRCQKGDRGGKRRRRQWRAHESVGDDHSDAGENRRRGARRPTEAIGPRHQAKLLSVRIFRPGTHNQIFLTEDRRYGHAGKYVEPYGNVAERGGRHGSRRDSEDDNHQYGAAAFDRQRQNRARHRLMTDDQVLHLLQRGSYFAYKSHLGSRTSIRGRSGLPASSSNPNP